mgnify:CR=1 FL=1
MANYRNISMDFWQDSKVVDDFTPEDRYMYLYCMTNPHTNLCGCYEITTSATRQAAITVDGKSPCGRRWNWTARQRVTTVTIFWWAAARPKTLSPPSRFVTL